MLELKVHVNDAGKVWERLDDRWRSGTSWIAPFTHPAIGSVAVTDGIRTAIVVRERTGPDRTDVMTMERGEYDRWVRDAVQDPLDYVLVQLLPGTVLLRAGCWGAAPVYVASDRSGVRASWRLLDVAVGIGPAAVDETMAVRYLVGDHGYTSRTLFTSVRRLTERSTLAAGQDGVSYVPPEPAPHGSPRHLRAGAEPLAMFEQILATSVRRYLDGGQPVAEVSGGLDSAIVGLCVAAQSDGPVGSYGILVGGPAGRQQVTRRGSLLRLGRFVDVTVPALSSLPFSTECRRSPFDPFQEPYTEALTAALGRAGAGGRTVLTGIGGDELMALLPGEPGAAGPWQPPPPPAWLTPRARQLLAADAEGLGEHPAPVLHETSLLAAACRAPVFLAAGAWPVNPLATPELVRFCEWLPPEWRRGRRLQRELLHRAGLDRGWVHPPNRENFAHVMRRALARHGLPLLRSFLPNLVLAEVGLVDPEAVEAAVSRRGPDADRLYELVNLELALRSLLG